MDASRDERIAAEVLAGRAVPDIAARYGVPEAYVDRVVEDAAAQPKKRPGAGLMSTGNRAGLAFGAGLAAAIGAMGVPAAVGVAVAVVVYLLATLVSQARR